jgi:hypothetical protein
MAQDHRIKRNGKVYDYSCENGRFRTDIKKGQPHGCSTTLGSVFDRPLCKPGKEGDSVWLEHVIEDSTRTEYYWLMRYKKTGVPSMPMSGILSREDIANMLCFFASNWLDLALGLKNPKPKRKRQASAGSMHSSKKTETLFKRKKSRHQ